MNRTVEEKSLEKQISETKPQTAFEKISPAFPGCDHCIVFCADNGYMDLTYVAIKSIINHADASEYYDILVFHGGIDSVHEDIYRDDFGKYDNIRVRLADVSHIFDGQDLYTENRESFRREAYFRLVTPWILTEDYKTALYLDGDMLIRKDITPLFETELGDNLLGAVKDYWGICNCYMPHDPRRAYRISIGLDDIDTYVISATLLFNLSKWRKQFSLEEVIRVCASKKWQQHDQDVVNILCHGSTVFLSATWGMIEDYGNNRFLPEYMYKEVQENGGDPAIAHFGGERKPYRKKHVRYDMEFWKCAMDTPYMGSLFGRIKSTEHRYYLAHVLDREGIEHVPSKDGTDLYYKGVLLGKEKYGFQKYKVIQIRDNVLHLECSVGYYGLSDGDILSVEMIVDGTRYAPVETHPETVWNRTVRSVYTGIVAVFELPLTDSGKMRSIRIDAKVNGEETPLSRIKYQRFAELSGRFKNDYYAHNGWIVQREKGGQSIIVRKVLPGLILGKEICLLSEVRKSKKVLGAQKAFVLRLVSDVVRPFVRKPIWLISDRMNHADDNGEVFYRYLKKYHKGDVRAFFLLLPDSPDYERMKELGDVIAPFGWRHKVLSLLAEWSVSSQIDTVYRDPFRDYGHPYRDILRKTRFVFLQHGVISADMSRLLDKDRQELDGFITSTPKEYASIVNGDYHYTDEQVWLTGLPRFDRIEDHREKVVTVMPTWRSYLFIGQNSATGEWDVKGGFENSRYARFYHDLMHHPRLREAASRLGYRVQFKCHPTCVGHVEKFGFDENVALVPEGTTYADIFSKSALLVTDYSSSIYDFVYLRKPVVYTHFDEDEFFSGAHMYDKGYFDYEKDGFGEVAYTLEDTVEAIVRYMETDCALREPYKTRIEETFPDRSANHCEQIYRKIKSKGRY